MSDNPLTQRDFIRLGAGAAALGVSHRRRVVWQRANAGNWEVGRDLYPLGLKPISDLLHSHGRKLLLWFEPERVCQGTPWYTEHRQWLLDVPKNKRVYRGFEQAANGIFPSPIRAGS